MIEKTRQPKKSNQNASTANLQLLLCYQKPYNNDDNSYSHRGGEKKNERKENEKQNEIWKNIMSNLRMDVPTLYLPVVKFVFNEKMKKIVCVDTIPLKYLTTTQIPSRNI